MLETRLRPIYQKFLVNPVASLLERHTQITPVLITLLAVLMGVIASVLIVVGYSISACLFLLLSGYFDSLDGTLARVKNESTPKGAVLDIVADRVVEFVIILGLYYVAPQTRGFAAMWMLGASLICVTSFLVVGLFIENTSSKSFHYSVGLMERAEAFAFFIVMILEPRLFIPLAWIYTSLVLYTAGVRVYEFWKSQ